MFYLKLQMSKPLIEVVLEKRVLQYQKAKSLKNTCEGIHFLVNLQVFSQDFELPFIWLLLETLSHHHNCHQPMGWTPKKGVVNEK